MVENWRKAMPKVMPSLTPQACFILKCYMSALLLLIKCTQSAHEGNIINHYCTHVWFGKENQLVSRLSQQLTMLVTEISPISTMYKSAYMVSGFPGKCKENRLIFDTLPNIAGHNFSVKKYRSCNGTRMTKFHE